MMLCSPSVTVSNSFTHPLTLSTTYFKNFNSPSELKQLHAHLIKTNTCLSILPLPRVGVICASTPSFGYAHDIFLRHLKDPQDVAFVWSRCLKELVESDSPIDAISLFNKLRLLDIAPDHFTCSFVLKACAKLLDISTGRVVHGYIEKLGFQSNLVLLNMVVQLYATCGGMDNARLMFDKMPLRDVVTWNIMITQLIKRSDVNGAYDLFSRIPDRNLRSWTSMISGYVQCGKPKEAIDLFLRMEQEVGHKPNEVTVVTILSACADLGALDLGRRIHEFSYQKGFHRNARVCTTLINMYVKCGCLEDACQVFYSMKERTIMAWSAMIAGFAMHGQGEEALKLYDEMIKTGMKPNEVTFIGFLHACSHMGLVEKGRAFFVSMSRDYHIEPQIEHYGCMVDLLSRAGLLKEAHEFILNMPMKPNSVIWGALLGGCRVHKNINLAEEAMRHISELDPLHCGYYVILSNIYAEAGRWEELAKVRMLMKGQGVKKIPGRSSIVVDGVMHEFVAGDETHPQAEEIFKTWDKLLVRMKRKGYAPNTSVVLLDVEDKEKEKFLFRHSEKLALVFGLIKTQPGVPIRIMKNLRVCEDCHSVFKLVSALQNREIIMRDRTRFHCFKDGACSCRDYW